ncbi:MAG: glycosyltransferase family 2 protein [Promethearchaeota archaeon]
MTSSISFKGFLQVQRFKRKKISNFKKRVKKVLKKYAFEYIDIYNNLQPALFYQLNETLNHWTKTHYINNISIVDFTRLKIIECFAFWKGFIENGGQFKKAITKQPTEKCLNDDERTHDSNNIKVYASIPVGYINNKISSILKSTISTLQANNNITKILVVLDGIPDIEVDFIKKFPKTEIFTLNEKEGPAKARNIAINNFMDNHNDFLLFIDSDVIINKTNLELLLNESLKKAGILCPKIYSWGNTIFDAYHDINGTLNGRYIESRSYPELLFGTTSCMLIPKMYIQAGIRFSTDFPIAAAEDIDFCLNARKKGLRIYPVDNARAYHWYGYKKDNDLNLHIFKIRFERYGRGEVMLLKKHGDYYSLLNQSIERVNE